MSYRTHIPRKVGGKMQAMKEGEELHVSSTAVRRRLTLAGITQTGSAGFVTHAHHLQIAPVCSDTPAALHVFRSKGPCRCRRCRRATAGLSPHRLVFSLVSVHIRFVVDKVALT
jgi:hypothetical protein